MSAILSVDTLNDFISPGVACIKPVETLPSKTTQPESNEYEVSFNTDAPIPSDQPPAQISLTDCLACSGCVTSAEAVLVSLQSHAEVLQELDSAPGLRLRAIAGGGIGVENTEQGGRIYVASVKASREELTDAAWEGTGTRGVRDVDSVITSKELLMLAEARRVDFSKLPRTPVPSRMPFPEPKVDAFLFPPVRRRKNNVPESGTSGGNLYYILQYVASQNEGAIIQTTRGRNADVLEYSVTSSAGETLFKAARYYGFRNIQNLVRRLKPAKMSRMPGGKPMASARKPAGKTSGPEYSYIEVMACPGGYGISPSHVKDALTHWAATTGLDLSRLVYTSYREVVSDIGKKVGDSERVIEIAGKMGGGW
ncbi:iron only hydrogenase large subunit domain-containing protein [Diplocarpon rosae]|nr:iron only hydrogenase large subunit domain-containing protein [Diplocarpon rosae]